eukprot:4759968-Pleurochrysis_carterae.AAC.1
MGFELGEDVADKDETLVTEEVVAVCKKQAVIDGLVVFEQARGHFATSVYYKLFTIASYCALIHCCPDWVDDGLEHPDEVKRFSAWARWTERSDIIVQLCPSLAAQCMTLFPVLRSAAATRSVSRQIVTRL